MRFMPPHPPDHIEERIRWMWDFSGPYPEPKFLDEHPCPACGYLGEYHMRHWLFQDKGQQGHRFRYRCDVAIKCSMCSLLLTFGVIVPDSVWDEKGYEPGRVFWQEAKGTSLNPIYPDLP